MQELFHLRPAPARSARLALWALIALVAVGIAARPADAAPKAVAPVGSGCPGFRVLHDDRIGAAVFPAGNYRLDLEATGLECKAAATLFTRVLEDYDGVLPAPWKVSAERSGRSAFLRGTAPGFSVELTAPAKEEGGSDVELGTLCPNTFTVLSTTTIKPLSFTKGKFLIYLPPRTAVTCEGAAALFRRFLGAGGTLPAPWRLMNQTATFYQPASPIHTAFRIEPLGGAGPR